MFEPITQRRYLLPFNAARLGHQFTDVLVIGGGVAGLRAAIAAADAGAEVLILTKDTLAESNTWYAQGGIAAVLQPADSYESHEQDTVKAGAGLCSRRAVEIVVTEGPQRVIELLQWGAHFDKHAGNAYDLDFAREGGHSVARIVHALGDATGQDVAQTLINAVRARERIRISEKSFVIDLVTDEQRCLGVTALIGSSPQIIWAKRTILASGGAGELYRESTNPKIATADGHAMAYRAGASMADMEMVQFHPTTLYIAGANRTLITEAVRGEGAWLVDQQGHRFMSDYDPAAELAPRDVVCQAIVRQIRKTHFTHVFLDVRHLSAGKFRERFPQLARLLDEFGIDCSKDLIPVHPAAHYFIGGVWADEQGRSTLDGLYAVGEASCSGLHGANRLGSNSLLEGLAFGARAGADAGRLARENQVRFPLKLEHKVERSTKTELDITDVKSSLRSLMWRNVGIERHAEHLAQTREIIGFWARYVMDKTFDQQVPQAAAAAGWEVQNMLTVCWLIASAAQTRAESRGVHFRTDFAARDDAHWLGHLLWRRGADMPVARPVEP